MGRKTPQSTKSRFAAVERVVRSETAGSGDRRHRHACGISQSNAGTASHLAPQSWRSGQEASPCREVVGIDGGQSIRGCGKLDSAARRFGCVGGPERPRAISRSWQLHGKDVRVEANDPSRTRSAGARSGAASALSLNPLALVAAPSRCRGRFLDQRRRLRPLGWGRV